MASGLVKKHFDAVAMALASEKPGAAWDPNKHVQWELDCRAVACALARFNPKFDRARFLKACGFEERHYFSKGDQP